MKKNIPLLLFFSILLNNMNPLLAWLPVKFARDKILFGSCPEQKCKQEQEGLKAEYNKLKFSQKLGGVPRPASYTNAEIRYVICRRDACGKTVFKRFIATGAAVAALVILSIIGGLSYTTIKMRDEVKRVLELYAEHNPTYPLSDSDKQLVYDFFGTTSEGDLITLRPTPEKQTAILMAQKDNLPFLYVVVALLQPNPAEFMKQYNLTDQRWIKYLQDTYKIEIGPREPYKEKLD